MTTRQQVANAQTHPIYTKQECEASDETFTSTTRNRQANV